MRIFLPPLFLNSNQRKLYVFHSLSSNNTRVSERIEWINERRGKRKKSLSNKQEKRERKKQRNEHPCTSFIYQFRRVSCQDMRRHEKDEKKILFCGIKMSEWSSVSRVYAMGTKNEWNEENTRKGKLLNLFSEWWEKVVLVWILMWECLWIYERSLPPTHNSTSQKGRKRKKGIKKIAKFNANNISFCVKLSLNFHFAVAHDYFQFHAIVNDIYFAPKTTHF